MSEKELSKEEKSAISRLKSLAKVWPKSLWLFSASGTLCVMKTDEKGHRVHHEHPQNCGVDQEYIVDTINIPNDGGDW